MTSSRRFLIPLAAFVLAGCTDGEGGTEPERPEPGALTVSLAAPGADARSLVLSIAGPDSISRVESAGDAFRVFSRSTGRTSRVAVFGPLTGGALVRFQVSDVKQAARYSATLVEVADTANQLRESPAGYTLSVHP